MPKKQAKQDAETKPAQPEANEPHFYKADTGAALPLDDQASFSWTASEFIAHEKSGSWYAALILVTILLTGVIYAIMRDILSGLVVIIGMALVGIYAGREPRELQYSLQSDELWIGEKEYAYDSFRCYSIFSEGVFRGIDLLPMKRFALTQTIYYHPDDEDKILAILGVRLPNQEYKQDFVDRLLRKIRF